MWKYIFSILIFCLVLFVYLHVNYHFKTSNDLEIYELDNGSKDKLDEVCNVRQPVILDFYNNSFMESVNKPSILGKFRTFELKVRNTRETDYENEIFLPLQLHAALKLFDEDSTASYTSENNQDFLQETGLIKLYKMTDDSIRPGMTSNCMYDLLTGSKNSNTPLRYEINHRNFFSVVSGEVEIKLAPPKYSRYLHSVEDYDNFEFRSPLNPWSIQEEYMADFEKIKFMDILLPQGKMIYIPPYWWYSIRYKENGLVSSFKYRTYMNNLAILPRLGINFLQTQNVKHRIAKKYNKFPTSDGVSNIEDLKPSIDSNELPILNPATSPLQEIDIPTSV